MNRFAALALASFASLAACQSSQPAPQAAPPPPPAPVVVVNPPAPTPPSLATPPSTVPGSGSRTVQEAFGSARHLILQVRTPGRADRTTKTLDDQIPAVIEALGATTRSIPAMPRCMTPVELIFSDANNVTLGSVGFCDTGTAAEVMHQPGRIDFADKTMGGFVAANPDALAKFLP